jgi:hypothetical protein
MGARWAASSILFWLLSSALCLGNGVTWIGAKDAPTASYSWDLKGDYFIVNVLVNGQSPFTCGLIEIQNGSTVALGEDGECDIRSPFFYGEITILVSGFLYSQEEPVDSSQATIYKDTIYPEATFAGGRISITDLNLDKESITCRNETTNSIGCPEESFPRGKWTVSAKDLASNTSQFQFEIR